MPSRYGGMTAPRMMRGTSSGPRRAGRMKRKSAVGYERGWPGSPACPKWQYIPGEPLSYYGIDLMALAGLSDRLGEWIGQPLPATAFYDRPSIDAMARYLAGRSVSDRPLNAATDGPIAVIGLACRFPGGKDSQAFWTFISEGRCAVAALPPDRRPLSGDLEAAQQGGFLPRIDLFDAPFFGISRARGRAHGSATASRA